jgi:vanillate O-demethylase ferredoxin subunit
MSRVVDADWRSARVVAVEMVATRTSRITVERPGPGRGRAKPGTHVDVEVTVGGRRDLRSYSVVESNDDGTQLTISVLRTVQSRGGSQFMHGLQVGDEIPVTQPLQNFPLRIGAPRYVLLAGGIGITALVEMARVLRRLHADYTLVYVARTADRMAYREELAALHGDRFEARIDEEGSPLDVDEVLAEVAAGPHQTELYMCGPIRLMDAVRRGWRERELPMHNLRFETFGNSGWFDPEEFVVEVPRLGIEAVVGTDTTMLEALSSAGLDLMYDCRKGECGLCLVEVGEVDGALDHRDVFLSERQQEAGRQLCTCVSRAVSRPGQSTRPTVTLV